MPTLGGAQPACIIIGATNTHRRTGAVTLNPVAVLLLVAYAYFGGVTIGLAVGYWRGKSA